MSKLIAAASMLAVSTSAALAADLPAQKYAPAAPVIVPPAFSWTGLHVGLTGGASLAGGRLSTHLSHKRHLFGAEDVSHLRPHQTTSAGFVAGASAGYDYQLGSVVLGIAGDYSWNWADHRHSPFSSAFQSGTSPISTPLTYHVNGKGQSRLVSFGTMRARVGLLATPDLMLYATGGAAYGSFKNSAAISAHSSPINIGGQDAGGLEPINSASSTANSWGWATGAGLEYAIDHNWSLNAEYLYVGFKPNAFSVRQDDSARAKITGRNRFHILRVGLNYRF